MIFWIFVLLLIAFIVFGVITKWDNELSFVGACLSGITVLFLSIVILVESIGAKGMVASNRTRYESLVYQYENHFYENDNEVGKYQLMRDIREWNEDLSKYKTLQRDFWVGIFIPNIYDEFEFIEIN